MYCPKCKKEIPPLNAAPDSRIIRELASADIDCEGNPVYDMAKIRTGRNNATICYWCGSKLLKEEPKPEPKPQPKPEPKPQPKPEPKPEPKPKPKPEPKSEPKPNPEPPKRKFPAIYLVAAIVVVVLIGLCFWLFKGGDSEKKGSSYGSDETEQSVFTSDGSGKSSKEWAVLEKGLKDLGAAEDFVKSRDDKSGSDIREEAYESYSDLKDEAYDLYNSLKDSAYEEYNTVKDEAYERYQNDEIPYEEYNKIQSEAYATYNRIQSDSYACYMDIQGKAYSWYTEVSSVTYSRR